jgi:cell division protein FtsW (lipid II flippase)
MIVYLANLISVERLYAREDYRFWMVPTGVFAVIAIFVGVLGSDAGTTIIMAFILFGMYYMGGLPWRYVTLLSIVAVIAMPLLMISNASRRGRVMAWLFPSAPDPNGYNWQSEHAKWAFASGGPFGVGLGNSKMKWSWLPEAQNDFIFAIIGEEWGMVGALFTIGLFISLGIVLFRIAKKTNDPYQRLVVYGVTFWIMGQAFINVSVVLTMFPVLGVNLPLISAGGSSILATLIAIGIVLGIERNNSISPSKRLVRSGVRR